jgi:tight adherence protein C
VSPAIYGLLAAACVGLGIAALPGLRGAQIGSLDATVTAEDARDDGIWRYVERLAARLGPRASGALSAGRRESINRRLDSAGRPDGMTVQRFVGLQAALSLIVFVFMLFFVLQGSSPFFLLIGVVMGWGAPEVWLSRRSRLRQERIERDLPDFLDILAVTVRAGLGYRLALQRVAESLGGPVGDEMLTALRQMGLGVQRREAFEALRDRNRSEALNSFVAAQIQAEELGVPLADALNDIAIDMRRIAHQGARRRAQRAAPRVALLTTTLIVPGAIILLLVSLLLGSGAADSGLLGG